MTNLLLAAGALYVFCGIIIRLWAHLDGGAPFNPRNVDCWMGLLVLLVLWFPLLLADMYARRS